MTSNGEPYAPMRYKLLVQERYVITKFIHTSYNEVGDMTPIERTLILDLIIDELKKKQELLEKARNKLNSSM